MTPTGRHDPIPAIREEDASGETATLFAELRQALGVPFVNLIWRHLATIPGGLAGTWLHVEPLYRSARLGDEAQRLGRGAAPDGLRPFPAFVTESAGLRDPNRAAIRTLLEDYNRANAANLLALLVALSALREEPASPAAERSVPAPRPRDPARAAARAAERGAPRLLGLDELAPPVLALVQDLDTFGRAGPSEALASLYRHLAHWPVFLALGRTALAPFQETGRLEAAGGHLLARARAAAGSLRPLAPPGPPLLGRAEAARVEQALDGFTRLMIGRMVVMGASLLHLLPDPPDGPER